MDCHYHPGKESTKTCDICGKYICDDCAIELAGKTYCKSCLENLVGGNNPQQEQQVREESITKTIQEMDSPYASDNPYEPTSLSFKSEIPNRESILEDVYNDNKSQYSQYDVLNQQNEEPQPSFDEVSYNTTNYNEPQPSFDEVSYNTTNSNPYDITSNVEESYFKREEPTNTYQENNFDDGFIYPDHTYEPQETQNYSGEPSYESYLNDLYDNSDLPLSEQLAKDEDIYGSISNRPAPSQDDLYGQYNPQNIYGQTSYNPQDMKSESYLNIDNVTYNNPQGDYIPPQGEYIPPKQQYSLYEQNTYQTPKKQSESGIRSPNRPIHNIQTDKKEKEPVQALDIVLTIILIILIIIVVFYVIYMFLLSSYYPTFTDAIYGLSNPGLLFSHIMGN